MIVIRQENILINSFPSNGLIELMFRRLDNGDVFQDKSLNPHLAAHHSQFEILGKVVLVVGNVQTTKEEHLTDNSLVIFVEESAEKTPILTGWTCINGVVCQHEVLPVPIQEKLFSRLEGLFETSVLSTKSVLIIGLGSGGSPIALELAKAGVTSFILIDHDRLEIENVVRHVCGIYDLGRFKTKAVRDLILDKNPYAQVITYEKKVTPEFVGELHFLIKQVDLVLCCTDNRDSRVIVNKACITEEKVCVYGGTFQRAYGGQVLRVTPGKSMCYQCFIDIMPDVATDQEISNVEQAQALAYSDRIVPIEPGLSNDIAPISTMVVKLAILELLKDRKTTLNSLYEDLPRSWYMWLNRREIETEYEQLPPMDEAQDELRILAWYGIENEPNPGCPVCGNFAKNFPGITQNLTQEDIESFTQPINNKEGEEFPAVFPPVQEQ